MKKVINLENSTLVQEVIKANELYAKEYVPRVTMFSNKRAAILTCMDPRIVLTDIMGFRAGDFYVIKNAGGRATDDTMRSLIISHKLLGTQEWFVIHHTDCGLQKVSNKTMDELLQGDLSTATLVKDCNKALLSNEPTCECIWVNTSNCCQTNNQITVDWMAIENGQENAVLEDVLTIRNHSLVPSNIPIYGYIFDVLTGRLVPVDQAMHAGRARPVECKQC